jgi:hypothetical protein
LLLAILYAKSGTGETSIQKELLSQPVPQAAPAAAPAADASQPADITESVVVETVETEATDGN